MDGSCQGEGGQGRLGFQRQTGRGGVWNLSGGSLPESDRDDACHQPEWGIRSGDRKDPGYGLSERDHRAFRISVQCHRLPGGTQDKPDRFHYGSGYRTAGKPDYL